MAENEAIELLKYHSFTNEDLDNPKSEKGFFWNVTTVSRRTF
jgi:hypothetical protein